MCYLCEINTCLNSTSTGKRPRHERPANGNTTNSERTAAMTSPGRQRRRNSLDVTIPTFPVVPEVLLVGNGAEQIREFIDSYQAHCTDLLRMFNKQTVEKASTT